MAVSTAAVNQMNQAVHPFQLNGYRFITVLVFTIPYLCWEQASPRPDLSLSGMFWLVCLLLCTLGWSVCFFSSAIFISIGLSGSVSRIGEIFLAAIAMSIISRKMIGWMKLLSVFLGIVGILCLCQKIMFFPVYKNKSAAGLTWSINLTRNDLQTHSQTDNANSFGREQITGIVLAALAAILNLGAISSLSVHLQNLKPPVLFFWVSFVVSVSSFLLAWPIEPSWTLPDNTKDWALFSTHCFCFVFASWFSWLPLYFASVFVTTLSFTTSLVFLFFIQWIFLGDISGPPGVYIEISGALLVMVSSFSVPLCDAFQTKKENQKKTRDTGDK